MKIFKRILLIVVILIIVLLVVGHFLLNNLRNAALPDYTQDIQIQELKEEVTILRDSFAIPHIYAQNETDLYMAVGFVMAQDRLWQMDLLRRVTQGRLSEIMGKDQLNTDLLMRALRIQEKSEKVLAQCSPDLVAALEAFCAGVNFYIENYTLPPEFTILGYRPEPWLPHHSLNLIGYMSWDLTSGWNTELLLHKIKNNVTKEQVTDLMPQMENHTAPVFTDFQLSPYSIGETLLSASAELEKLGLEIFNGSNNWAVSGKKSKTGKPLLANDMHLGLFAPGIWYQMHHVAEGSVNVTGLVLPGQPFVICGHNDSIAWGMTNVYVDDLDFYAEILNEDSTHYLLDGKWEKFLIKEEKIRTKEGQEIIEKLRFTHRGPIVNRFKEGKDTPVSIRWIGNEMSNEMRTIYLLNRANNWYDFREAVKTFICISQNIVFADVAGNIGLQCSAGVPLRAGSGINIFPGDISLYDWRGFVPFDELPFEFNPERGYVSSANNKTVPEDYPYKIGHWYAVPDRIERIREMLEETEELGVGDFCLMQGDLKSKKAEKMIPEFLNILNDKNDWNEIQKTALEKLQNWNFEMTRESQAASIFEIIYRKLGENLVRDDLSPEVYKDFMGERILMENLILNIFPEKNSLWIDDKSTPKTETFSDLVIRSFEDAIDELYDLSRSEVEDWNWGKIHTFTLSHPLAVVNVLDKAFNLSRGPFSVPGSYHTVCPYSYSFKNLYNVHHGASHRHVFDLAYWDNSKTIIPTGTSGIPASDFYLDQTEMYLNNRYHSDPFKRSEIVKKTMFTMKLHPK